MVPWYWGFVTTGGPIYLCTYKYHTWYLYVLLLLSKKKPTLTWMGYFLGHESGHSVQKKSQPWYGWSYVQILVLQSVLFMLRFAFAFFGTEGVDLVLGTRVWYLWKVSRMLISVWRKYIKYPFHLCFFRVFVHLLYC